MARKFTLVASPTFKAKVMIPVAGSQPAPIEFIFKHRDTDVFKEWMDNLKGSTDDVELIKDIASGWDLDDPFDDENILMLTQNYMGSARAVVEKYIAENTGAKLGN